MNPLDRTNYDPEGFARHVTDQRERMQRADGFVYYMHSRTGLLARFLQRMADRIDPTGEARRGQS